MRGFIDKLNGEQLTAFNKIAIPSNKKIVSLGKAGTSKLFIFEIYF